MVKKLFFSVMAFIVAGVFVSAQDSAASIVERSRNRIQADTVSTHSRMVITNRSGAVSERVMIQYSKDDAQGNSRSVIIFQEPASVRGTRFLTIENAGRDNDQWIFLPSLGRVRRIAGSEGSNSFMNTDFSYDDIASMNRNVDLDNHRIIREERFEGKDCYVIESMPKDSAYQYSRMVQWIEKGNFVNHKVELYDRRGTQVKLLEILEYREIQGRLSPFVTKMSTLAAGSSTSLNVIELRYDANIPEGVFTPRYLETGRP